MRNEAQFLWDITEAADAIDRFMGTTPMDQFMQDDMMRSAVYAKLIIIGEAVSHLSPALTEKYPSIPWHKIRGFRNAVIHGYLKIDWDIVWTAATQDAHQLRQVATDMLQQEFPHIGPENP
jgi:uncharacterized protein with HEPN domain